MLATIYALPKVARVFLLAFAVSIGVWASHVNLEFFKHGATALEADLSLRDLVITAAYLLVVAEMASFLLAGLMPGRELFARRWALYGVAGAVLAFDVGTITAVQISITSRDAIGQGAIAQQIDDIRKRIASIESSAAQLSAAAEKETASNNQWVQVQGAKDAKEAARLKSTVAPLYDQISALESQRRPALMGVFCALDPDESCTVGKRLSIGYVVARGLLVSCIGLVFFGAAGAIFRTLYAAGSGKERPHVETPATQERPHVGTPSPSFGVSWPSWLGAGALGAGLTLSGVSANANPPSMPVSEAARTPSPEPEKTPSPEPEKTPTTPAKPTREATVKDTGTGADDGARYGRILAAVRARSLEPSIRAIKSAARCGDVVATRYRDRMAQDGIIERTTDGKGWQVKA